MRNVRNMPVMKESCATCPFRDTGWQELRTKIIKRILTEASQTCHSTGSVKGKRDTHLCRGARDAQLQFFFRLGVISEPTDKAWSEKATQLQNERIT